MSAPRLTALRALLEKRPDDPRLLFGVAVEELGVGRTEEGVRSLRHYLSLTDDEGNGWARLGEALQELGETAEAREALSRGIEAAERHGHPTLADELRETLKEM